MRLLICVYTKSNYTVAVTMEEDDDGLLWYKLDEPHYLSFCNLDMSGSDYARFDEIVGKTIDEVMSEDFEFYGLV